MKMTRFGSEDVIHYYHTDIDVEITKDYEPKELRGLWVSNVMNIDMPTTENLDSYIEKMNEIIRVCKEFNINAIFFQVRTSSDAFYDSALNPYSRYLTGKEGRKPPFDVFQVFLNKAKNAGIDVHAWCNPYRINAGAAVSIEDYLSTCDDLNFAKIHPETIILDQNNKMIFNPALQVVRDFITDSMVEIVRKYDVAGIHFDDYFYPYAGLSNDLNDLKQWEEQALSIDDFRRENVNLLLKQVNTSIKKIKPNVSFGISPFGIWKNKKEGVYGSNTDPACTESYTSLYADTLAWIEGGYIDYVVPQIYWDFGHKIAPFADILDFWVDVCKDKPVKLYIGHGAYRLGSDGNYLNKEEIVNQVKYANQFETVKGNVFFTFKTFIDQDKALEGMTELKKLMNEV